MRWNRYRIKIRTDAEDMVIAALYEVGVEGVEVEDKVPLSVEDQKQMFVDIPPSPGEDDGIAYVSFYLDADDDNAQVIQRVREALDELRTFMEIGEGTIEISQTEDKDWINNWKQYFHQFYVDDLLIIPSWEKMDEKDKDKLVLHIDPGTAFGTGMHETTQLCLRALRSRVTEGMEVLDIGTGSGILSIAALKLGAGHAVGTDLDPCAISAARENLEANDISAEKMDVLIGNLIDDPAVQESVGAEKYDLVAANILAEVLVLLTPQAARCMKHGGIYITSGILQEKAEMVTEAIISAGLRVEEITHQGEWAAVIARKD